MSLIFAVIVAILWASSFTGRKRFFFRPFTVAAGLFCLMLAGVAAAALAPEHVSALTNTAAVLGSFDWTKINVQTVSGLLVALGAVVLGGHTLETALENWVMGHIDSVKLKAAMPAIGALLAWTVGGWAKGLSCDQILMGALSTWGMAVRIHNGALTSAGPSQG